MNSILKIKNLLPDEMFDIKIYNKISFIVIDHLKNAFDEVSETLKKNDINRYNNLIGLFFHRYTQLLCSYYFLAFEIKCLGIKHNIYKKYFTNPYGSLQWPINLGSFTNNSFHEVKTKPNKQYRAREIVNGIFNILSASSKHTAIVLPNVASVSRRVLIRNGIKIRSSPNSMLFEYVLGKEQWSIFNHYLLALNSDLKKQYGEAISLSDVFLSFLQEDFFHYHKRNRKISINSEYIITGSMASLASRITCANAKTQGKKVIHVWHGESIGTMIEPVFSIIDKTYCDYIIGYGSIGCDEFQNMKDSDLFNENPKIISRKSNKINSIYKNKNVDRVNKRDINLAVYTPTSFSGAFRYGPYRDYNDLIYLYWQETMLEEFMKLFKPVRMIKKQHRKEKIIAKSSKSNIELTRKLDFSMYLDSADLFLFDYPTTAFNLAAATFKPIIYFDIGLRNLSNSAKQSIKDRCIYIEGNPNRSKEMVATALINCRKKCINTYTEKYSLTQNSSEIKDVLARLINNVG